MRFHSTLGRRIALPLVGALAIGAVLAGCSGQDDELPAMPFDTVAMPVDRATTATPGQHLASGEIALLPQTDFSGAPDDAIETSVIGIAAGEPSYWERFENGAEFDGDTPFFAVIQYRWVTGSVTSYTTPLLRPILDDGTEGGIVQREYLGSLTADTACPFEVPEFAMEDDRGTDEYIACVVYTAPIGSTIVGLGWNNLSDLAFSAPDPAINPYYTNPAVWDVTPIQPKKK